MVFTTSAVRFPPRFVRLNGFFLLVVVVTAQIVRSPDPRRLLLIRRFSHDPSRRKGHCKIRRFSFPYRKEQRVVIPGPGSCAASISFVPEEGHLQDFLPVRNRGHSVRDNGGA